MFEGHIHWQEKEGLFKKCDNVFAQQSHFIDEYGERLCDE
jgi:hypothetical protein